MLFYYNSQCHAGSHLCSLTLNVPSAWNFATPNPTCRIVTYLKTGSKVLPFALTEPAFISYRTDQIPHDYFPSSSFGGLLFVSLLVHFLHTVGTQSYWLHGVDNIQLRACDERSNGTIVSDTCPKRGSHLCP